VVSAYPSKGIVAIGGLPSFEPSQSPPLLRRGTFRELLAIPPLRSSPVTRGRHFNDPDYLTARRPQPLLGRDDQLRAPRPARNAQRAGGREPEPLKVLGSSMPRA